ncbi:MAG: hypothetical protein ABIG37_02550 [Nanoarchaeota archaeon]|nr:hypothetical protein [Nanoarchaeota archaeon]
MQEPEHILKILQETKDALSKNDVIKLKNLSNQTIHSASINQDTESITIAVIIYSLSKIIERTDYKEYSGWKKFFKSLIKYLDSSIYALKEKNIEKFNIELKKIRGEISKLPGSFKKHIKEVFEKASINKASRIYEHGISMEKTSKLLGISMWELAKYAGQTGISDVNLSVTMPIEKRIKIAMDIFK